MQNMISNHASFIGSAGMRFMAVDDWWVCSAVPISFAYPLPASLAPLLGSGLGAKAFPFPPRFAWPARLEYAPRPSFDQSSRNYSEAVLPGRGTYSGRPPDPAAVSVPERQRWDWPAAAAY